jgi:hypothetical protein
MSRRILDECCVYYMYPRNQVKSAIVGDLISVERDLQMDTFKDRKWFHLQ